MCIATNVGLNGIHLQNTQKNLKGCDIIGKANIIYTKQSITEHIDYLIKNREDIVLSNMSETEDYYSFLRGFDYAINSIKYILNEERIEEVYYIINQGTKDAWISSKSVRDLTMWEIEGIDKDGHYFSTKEKAEMSIK